ncbi:hypothetical protein A33M_1775 [Rhodovulum sp. PH10]|nr:hypothetical protein A33M_1775 [Rhodovulum sp. PH10]
MNICAATRNRTRREEHRPCDARHAPSSRPSRSRRPSGACSCSWLRFRSCRPADRRWPSRCARRSTRWPTCSGR